MEEWGAHATSDNLLLVQNFLSFRMLYGDDILNDSFHKLVMKQMKQSSTILYRLAEEGSTCPKFRSSNSGYVRLDRHSIDIKIDVLFPLHHSLQTLSTLHEIVEGTPIEGSNKRTC
ncbi:hypothetical protein KHA80_05075 [Anaerobacillus sp. HL2]|nr:hypothetical protein KHA80_05075 [Anaerobacillus sp. HL2]